MIPIRIPSYQRSDRDLCTTPATMHALGFRDIGIYVRESQAVFYDRVFPKHSGIDIIQIPDKLKGISAARQYMLENERRPFLMIDDDVRSFSYKQDTTKFGGLRPARHGEFWREFDKMLKWFREQAVAAAAIVDRYVIARPSEQAYHQYGFLRQCMLISPKLKNMVRFDRVPLFQDIDFSLQLLTQGIPVYITRKLCQESRAPSMKHGGCAELRQKNDNREIMEKLAKLHPEVIQLNPDKLAEKKICRIAWHKAYKIGQEKQ